MCLNRLAVKLDSCSAIFLNSSPLIPLPIAKCSVGPIYCNIWAKSYGLSTKIGTEVSKGGSRYTGSEMQVTRVLLASSVH